MEKQHRTPQKMVEKPKNDGTVDIGGLWTDPDADAAIKKHCRAAGLCWILQRSQWSAMRTWNAYWQLPKGMIDVRKLSLEAVLWHVTFHIEISTGSCWDSCC